MNSNPHPNTSGIPGVSAGPTSSSFSVKADMRDVETVKDRYFEKVFSKNLVRDKIGEYKVGKYTKKYIEVYLDFVHMEGIVNNLEFL